MLRLNYDCELHASRQTYSNYLRSRKVLYKNINQLWINIDLYIRFNTVIQKYLYTDRRKSVTIHIKRRKYYFRTKHAQVEIKIVETVW